MTAAEAGVDEMREAYEALHAQFAAPPEIAVRPVSAGGVPSLLVSPPDEPSTRLLYLHGGGYMLGSAFGYRHLSGALALAAGAGALVPDYRLAPEHPFPAALEDALSAYRWLLDRGTEPEQIVVAGDSSGGGLAMSALLALKRDGLPQPAGAVLLCPGVDLTFSMRTKAHEPQRCSRPTAPGLRLSRRAPGRRPDREPADRRPQRPAAAADPGRDRRRALPEAQALAARAREHGVDARLELYPVATHVFQVFWSFLPEATEALESAGGFARDGARLSHADRAAGRAEPHAARGGGGVLAALSAVALLPGALEEHRTRPRPTGGTGRRRSRSPSSTRRPRSRPPPRPPAPASAAGGWSRARELLERGGVVGIAWRIVRVSMASSKVSHLQAFWFAQDALHRVSGAALRR